MVKILLFPLFKEHMYINIYPNWFEWEGQNNRKFGQSPCCGWEETWGDGGVGRLPKCPSAWIKTQTLPFLQTLLCKQWCQALCPVSTFTYIVFSCVSHNKTCRG